MRAPHYRIVLRVTTVIGALLAVTILLAGAYCGWWAARWQAELSEARAPISRARLIENLTVCGQQLADARRKPGRKVEVAQR